MDAVSVTAPAGFAAAGVVADIKPGGALDLAVVAAAEAGPAAGVFTLNRAAAAPVLVSRAHLVAGPSARAVVLNSGCANAATGVRGDATARMMTARTGELLGCAPEEVLVCSTGTIGTFLDEDAVRGGIEAAVSALGRDLTAGAAAARAIMTTDTVPKETVVDAGGFVVGGMAKGAGMVRPDMATMLAVLTTDAVVGSDDLADGLHTAVDRSFHSLNIDGCASTNDSVVVLASGASGVRPNPLDLAGALAAACRHLAEQLAADAEGAFRVIALRVTGAVDDAAARAAGRAISDSALVRSSFYGGDPNWGRVLGALGASDVEFDPRRVSIGYAGVVVAAAGVAADHDEGALLDSLASGDFVVAVDLGAGPGDATVLTTDLTPDYVRFNGERS
jgi:glutamate N-acetyltransferase/amino-acid N-acetyltransferase